MSVWKYVKVHGTWHYKAAIEDKGKIIPNMVRVDGKVEFYEEGPYYFRSGRQWIKLDAMPTSTQEARERLQAHDLFNVTPNKTGHQRLTGGPKCSYSRA